MSANVIIILGTIVVPSVVILFVCAVTFVNLYLNIRRRFPAKVNCWFCNNDTRVPYDQLNAFVCPTCHQYNGFTEDGDYNREIPEQYLQRLNNYCYHQPTNSTDDDKWGSSARSIAAPRNGLCFGCNRNQELKIHQLASFVPDDEDNYDAEVEEYRKQLEQTYKLCGRCERILRRTLNDVKRNILGSKLAQIGSKSLKVLDMHMKASSKQLAHLKRQRWAKVCVYAISGLLLMKLSQELTESGWTVTEVMLLCPPSLLSSFTVVVSYLLAIKQLIWKQWEKLLTEPAIQHTTERMELFGSELFQRYAPQLMQCSAPLLESFARQAPIERSSAFLLNGAIMALGALLASLGSQRTAVKQMLILTLCITDCTLKYMQYQNTNYQPSLLLTLAAIGLAISCIGQRVVQSNVARGSDMNSSFHKIYSQQCNESDYSDVDTTANSSQLSPGASFKLDYTSRFSTQDTKRVWNEAMVEPTLLAGNSDTRANFGRKSLDTTKSGSPSISPTSSFFMNSYTGNSSKINASLFNVAEAEEPVRKETRSIFNPTVVAPPPGSLLKAPSFSVGDIDFQATVKNHQQAPWNALRKTSGTPSIAATRAKQFHHSMSTINHQEATNAFRREDPLIEDDIDRLSISGRVSMNGSFRAGGAGSISGSRALLANVNPFAQVKPSRGELHFDEISPDTLLRQRRLVRSSRPEMLPTTRESLWSGFLATGAGGQQPHMSRTSSQSSGFESQVETTRRNTPTEGEALTVCTGPDVAQLDTLKGGPPSPVPSSASMFYNRKQGSSTSASQVRSLFNEQSLFNHALQQKSPTREGPSGLFFPKHNPYALPANSGIASGAPISMNRHIFPPQQSQTPSSYHHHYSLQQSNNLTGIGSGGSSLSLNSFPITGTSFDTPPGLVPPQASHPTPSGLAGAVSFYTSNQPTATGGRASVLNLGNTVQEINSGPQPTV